MEYIRAKREVRHALVISDPSPVDNVHKIWASLGQAATIGIFLLLFGAFLYIGHAFVLPVLAAAIVALTLAPLIKAAKRYGIPPWITAILVLLVALGAVSLIATVIAGPVSEWIRRAPEIGATIKEKLSVLDQPLASLHQLQNSLFGNDGTLSVSEPASNVVLPVVAFLTPAAGELLLFFATLLFFLVGQIELRNHAMAMFSDRDAKLRFLKIMRDIERNLAGYLTVVTIVNTALGMIVALGAWLIGLPNPVIFGMLAGLVELRALCRTGDHGDRAVRRRLGHFPVARPRLHRADRAHRAHHHGRAFRHADHRRPPPHAQSASGVSGAGVLDLDVGPDRRGSGRAAVDHRPRHFQSFVSARRRPTAGLIRRFRSLTHYQWNFLAAPTLIRATSFSKSRS